MSDRTMIALGRNSFSVPRIAKRALQVLTVTGLTAMVSLFIVMSNAFLTVKDGPLRGFSTWYAFVTRPDIIGTSVLTAAVTVAYLFWHGSRDSKR
ncbi:MAG: hypothetical protein ABL894_13595 [Hyphomicrobium sp.]